MTYSATVLALAPGAFATAILNLFAADIGIMSKPAPWRITAFRRFARSKSSGGNGERTMM